MRTFWRGDGVRRRVEVDVSQQLFDQTPGGVLDQAIAQELGQANGTGMDVTVVTALLGTSGIVTKT